MNTLKKAQKRLASFMEKENASLSDCAKILLIDESNLSLFMAQKSGSSTYAEHVLKCFGSDNNKRNLAKLQDIQVSQANPRLKSAAEKKYVQGLPAKAIHALDEFMKRHGFKAEKASIELGWAKGNAYQVKWLHRKNELGKRAAISILDAIYHYEAARAAASHTNCKSFFVKPEVTLNDMSNITKEDIAYDRQSRDKSNSSRKNLMRDFIRKRLFNLTTKLPCRLIDIGGKPYLERYFLCELFGVRAYLHRFVSEDAERSLHDHPWSWAFSTVLAGMYYEERFQYLDVLAIKGYKSKIIPVRWFNIIRGNCFHRISGSNAETWTLFIHGKKTKGWGFLTSEKHSVLVGSTAEVSYKQPFDLNASTAWELKAPLGKDAEREPLS